MNVRPCFFALGTLWLAGCATQGTVYDQLGGAPGVRAIVADFVYLMATDENLGELFAFTDAAAFEQHLATQFCALTGGGCTYTGEAMTKAHKGMNITHREFNFGVEHLQQAMIDNGTPLAAQNRLLSILAPMREEIVKR
ncbi:MAG: group 1 truncated hemoglobin [Gammaproteobacteria bacterium]